MLRMKYHGLLLAAILGSSVLAVIPIHARAADPTYTDTVCPRAVPKVTTFNGDAIAKNYAKLVDDAQAVVSAYRDCTTDARATAGLAFEPTVNYDQTRTAQYLVVLGRLQAAAGNPVAAVTSLKSARALAGAVADWIPSAAAGSAPTAPPTNIGHMGMGMGSMAPSTVSVDTSAGHNSDRQPSRYKDAAVQIQVAADAELAKLGAAPTSAPAEHIRGQ
jgi:hypothetical protein